MLLWTVGSFLELITVAVQDVRASTAFIVLAQFSKTALLMGAAALVGTVDALVVAALVQGVVQITVMVLYLRRRFPGFWGAFDWPLLRRQGAYALPLGMSSLVIQLQDTFHHLFVSHAFGPAGYAIYSVGVTQLPLVGILRESAGAVMLPRINQLESENGRLEILDPWHEPGASWRWSISRCRRSSWSPVTRSSSSCSRGSTRRAGRSSPSPCRSCR